MMKMYFHFGYEETILFEFWKTSSPAGLLLSAVIIGSMAFLTEVTIFANRYLLRREAKKNSCYDIEISPIVPTELSNGGSHESTAESLKTTSECQPSTSGYQSASSKELPIPTIEQYCQPGTSKCPPSPSYCHEKCYKSKLPRYGFTHFVTTFIYGYQTVMNMLLMLSFMTYNVWLCLAVVICRVIGYACFHGR